MSKLGTKNKKVDFVIAGTQKGGTSALDVYLRQNPEICMAEIKETHFFDNEEIFSKSDIDYSFYHSYFSQCNSSTKWGESTPIYMYWKQSPRRIFDYNRDMKIIIILRNPITRAYSHWNMESLRYAEDLSFPDAIQAEEERLSKISPGQHRVYYYLDRGLYTIQLERIWEYFPKNQTLILKFEDLFSSTQETLDCISDFLEVKRHSYDNFPKVFSQQYGKKMGRKEKSFLKEYYKEEIMTLEELLGWDCSDWLNLRTL